LADDLERWAAIIARSFCVASTTLAVKQNKSSEIRIEVKERFFQRDENVPQVAKAMEGGVLGKNEVGDYVRVVDAQHALQQLGGDRRLEQALTAVLLCKAEMEMAVIHYRQRGCVQSWG
jgi:hypothetical protein